MERRWYCMRNGSNPWWTVCGAIPIVWNATHWNTPERHVSRIARQHPLATMLALAAYAYHFLGPVKKTT